MQVVYFVFEDLLNLPSVSWENKDGDHNHAQTQQYPEDNDNLLSWNKKKWQQMFYSLLLLYFDLINDLSGGNIITTEDIITLSNSV